MDSPPAIITNDEFEFEELLADTKPTSDNKLSERSSKITMEKKELASIVDAAVDSVLSRMGKLFMQQKLVNVDRDAAAFSHAEKLTEDLKAEHRNHTIWLEQKHKQWKREDRKERREERKKLVEEIERLALELGNRHEDLDDPLVLVDAVGRKFIFPFGKCETWGGFEDLVKQAFSHVDIIGHQVNGGYYDIVSPEGHIILPSIWDEIIEPGWELSMHMWPMSEPHKKFDPHLPPLKHDPHPRGQESMAVDNMPVIDDQRCHRAADGREPEPHVPAGPLWDIGEQGTQCVSIGSRKSVDDPVAETGLLKESSLLSSLSQKLDSKTEQEASEGESRLTDVTVLVDEPANDAVHCQWDALEDD